MSTISAELPAPVDFQQWIGSIRHELQPPVGNKMLFGKGLHKVMVVGGPNVRKDYHIEDGEELFFQLEGDMCLEVFEHGKPRPIPIPQGSIYMLPGRIPHSPQRQAGTVGLVLERDRRPDEIDGLRWYTSDNSAVLYEETFHCTDLGTQLKPAITRYFASEAHASGKPSKRYEDESPLRLNETREVGHAVDLREWASAHANGCNAVLYGAGATAPPLTSFEYKVEVKTMPDGEWEDGWRRVRKGTGSREAGDLSELFLYQIEGSCTIDLALDHETEWCTRHMGPGTVLLVPDGHKVKVRWQVGCLALAVTNDSGLRP